MKIIIKIILSYFLILCPFLKGETIENLLIHSIQSSPVEGWEYSSRGGYIFKAEMDLVGDSTPEKMVWFSIDGYGSIHLFDLSSDQKYLGRLDSRLLGSPMIKENGRSTIFSISDIGNYPIEGEEAFTKKVISTVISTERVEIFERVAGVGPGDIDDKQFNEILNGSMNSEVFTNFKPSVMYISLRSFLNGEDNWADFKQDKWVEVDSYLVHEDDVAIVKKIKSSVDQNEIESLLGDFTQAKALKLLGNIEHGQGIVERIDGNGIEKFAVNKLEFHQENPQEKSIFLPWLIVGIFFVIILSFIIRFYKKS